MEKIFFYSLSFLTLLSALFVILFQNPIYSAGSLILSLFFIAGIYALLVAHFLVAIQILVYAGAVMVLFVFVIMLLNLKKEEYQEGKIKATHIAGFIFSIFIFLKLYLAIKVGAEKIPSQNLSLNEFKDFGSISNFGNILFRDFLLPFELTSILLLVAIIGTVVIAKRRLGK